MVRSRSPVQFWPTAPEYMKQLVKRTREIAALKKSNTFSIEARFIDLVEEVGELANAILGKEGHKDKKRIRADLADSVADILWDLIFIAEYYKIDIEKEYFVMCDQLEKRIQEKEFEG